MSFLNLRSKSFWASAVLLLGMVTGLRAANPSGDLRIEVITAYNLVVDSNVESPSSYAPRSAYLSAKIYNDGTNDLQNVYAYIGNYIDGVNDTPGIYPSRVHTNSIGETNLFGPLPGGAFALTHEGGTAGTSDATRYLGTIPAGGYVAVYWLISYPNLDENGDAVWGPSVKPDDDLWLEYDIWATADDGGVPLAADVVRKVTMRNMISAAANKIYPNGANKVPDAYKELLEKYDPAWTNLYSDGTPGTRIWTEGIWYDLGNVGDGFDNDGDLVPDRNAWMQPVGDPTTFDSSAFRLVRTYAMVVVKLKTGGELVYQVEDQLYFENIPPNNGAVGLVRYEFLPLKSGGYSALSPYQTAASGSDNEKFSGDYGATLGDGISSGISRVELSKDGEFTVLPGSNINYKISYSNAGDVAVGDPGLQVPLVLSDFIPDGTVYVAGSATNSNVLPAGVAYYTVLFSTNAGVTWTDVEPVNPTNVTDIQWWLSDELDPAAFGEVGFSVKVNSPYTNSASYIRNEGGGGFGGSDPFTNSTVITTISGTNRLGDKVFVDDGAVGGVFGNGLQDGSEAGISNVTVRLYLDINANGVIDGDDVAAGTQVTDGSGSYLFTGLFDGMYIVAVDTEDSDIPFGYTSTTQTFFSVNLDNARTNAAMVAYLDADFGFAPALMLDKSGPGSVLEGEEFSYTINITNRFAGSGGVHVYNVWATNLNPNTTYTDVSAWTSVPNSYEPPYSDGLYATCLLKGVGDKIGLDGHVAGPWDGSIEKVELVIAFTNAGGWNTDPTKTDTIEFNLYTNSANTASLLFSTNMPLTALPVGATTIVYDLTSLKVWEWAHFNGSNVISIVGAKVANPDGGSFGIDQAGFRITSDQSELISTNNSSIIESVPVRDTYDADLLMYLDADPRPTSVTTNGVSPNATGVLYWANMGPLYAGQSKDITVTFKALEPLSNLTATVTNTASITNALYGTGKPANAATDSVATVINPAGTIGDYIWRDIDGDGVIDAGDTGIANIPVVLTPPAGVNLGNGAGNPITNLTDTSGYYLFESLPTNGSYTVRVLTNSLPGGTSVNTADRDGTKDSVTSVSITHNATNGSDTVLDADFGYTLATMIDGTIWHDIDRDGAAFRESGEDWLAGVLVYLYAGTVPGAPGTEIATNYTSAGGYFVFTGAYSGNYTVQAVPATGSMTNGTWVRSFDTDSHIFSVNYVTMNVVSGGVGRADFSYYRTGSSAIGDFVFYDWDGDGIKDAEDEGIPGITVNLYEDFDGDGAVDEGVDAFAGSVETSLLGYYLFPARPPGNYIVIVDQTDPDFPPRYNITADPYGANDGRSALTITTADNLLQDFGYQPYGRGSIGDTVWYDANSDGVQAGPRETGLSSITVALLVDFNNNNTYVTLRTMETDAAGKYLFGGLPDGKYRVQIDSNDADIPADSFGNRYVATTATSFDITITNGSAYLTADAGFAGLGAIGDTIFWDANESGSQDVFEEGIQGVTVNLYVDNNGDGLYDPGDTFHASDITDADGFYLFSALPAGRYVVVVAQTGPLAGAVLSADPDSDGVPASDPEAVGADGQYGLTISGNNFMGADFGYIPAGIIGDTIWIDQNEDGIRDDSEQGIPYVTVLLYTNGTLVATNETDSDGYYMFSNNPDGVYNVVVSTNDLDWPANLVQVYDPDGTPDDQASNIVISNGYIVSIGGVTGTNLDLTVDFGYKFTGSNALSGTIGLDAEPYDGLIGTGSSGYNTNESPFVNVQVYLYFWNDDGDDIRQAGEVRLIASSLTDTNGDYAFSELPDGDGNDHYIVSIAAPDSYLILTTTNGSTPAISVSNTVDELNYTLAAMQVTDISLVVTNIDFAFRSGLLYDFGDLPQSYGTLISDNPRGPQHRVKNSPDLYLGLTVDTENNGQPSVEADGDGADEDGVMNVGVWSAGVSNGYVEVTVGAGSGWVVGFIDFNNDGDFTDAGELVASFAASTNGGVGGGPVYTNIFEVPANAVSSTNVTTFYARYRLLPQEPGFAEFAFSGKSDNGEVEDYFWRFGAIGSYVWKDLNMNNIKDVGEPGIEGVRVYVDVNGDGVYQANEPSTLTDSTGWYAIGGFSPGTYSAGVDTSTLPAYVTASYDLDGAGTANIASFSMTNGQLRTNVDFAYAGMAIGGQVWLDENADGLQNENPTNGVPNITVRLYDAGTNLMATSATDAGGYYLFDISTPGSYFMEFVPLTYLVSPKDVGDDALDSDVRASAPFRTDPTSIEAGERDFTWDMGLYLPAYSNFIGDRVWIDYDRDGVQDPEETNGYAGLTVELYDSTKSVVVASTLTDVDGNYYFSGVTPSNYYIRFYKPADYFFSPTNAAGGPATDSDADSGGFTPLITISADLNDVTWDCGIYAEVDVAVTKTINDSAPDVGDTVWYTIVASNAGPSHATGVKFTDTWPTNLTYLSHGATSGTYSDATKMWDLGTLSSGAVATLTVTGLVATAMPYQPVTNIIALTSINEPDSNTNNNQDDATLSIAVTDLGIGKSVNNANPYPGSNVQYTIVITNFGPVGATGVVVSEPLTNGLVYVSHSNTVGTAYNSTNGLWTVGNLAVSNTASLWLTAMAGTNFGGRYVTNWSRIVSLDQFDTVTNNNQDDARIQVVGADLQVTKTVDDLYPSEGDDIVWTVTVFNNGPNVPTNIAIVDALPLGMTYVGHTASAGAYSTDTSLWTIPTLALTNSATLAITCHIYTNNPYMTIENFAQITASSLQDPNTNNNRSSAIVNITDPHIYKYASPSNFVYPGSNITYTIIATNEGNSVNTGVDVIDALPAGVSFTGNVTWTAPYYTNDNVSDSITAVNYSNSDGTVPWSGSWTEIGEGTSPSAGRVQVVSDSGNFVIEMLRSSYGIWRGADLTTNKWAQLTFDYKRVGLSASEYMQVLVSSGGGQPTVEIGRINGAASSDGSYQSASFNIDAYISTNTTIGFRLSPGSGQSDVINIDAVNILLTNRIYKTAIGSDPPNLTTNWVLYGQEYMKYVYDVTVANPPTVLEITNTASISSDLVPEPKVISTVTPVYHADLGITKMVNTTNAGTNEVVWYDITVTNYSKFGVDNIEVTEFWPSTVTFSNASVSVGSYDTSATNAHIWSGFNLGPNGSATLVITGVVHTIDPDIEITNTVGITKSSAYDPNPNNNTAKVAFATMVVVGRFDVFKVGGSVVVEWETGVEIETLGFDLLRIEGDDYVKVNSFMIPAVQGSPQGGIYSLVDNGASMGVTETYMLVETEVNNRRNYYGPYRRTVGAKSKTGPPPAKGYSVSSRRSPDKEARIERAKEQKLKKLEEGRGGRRKGLESPFAVEVRSGRNRSEIKARDIQHIEQLWRALLRAWKQPDVPGQSAEIQIELGKDGRVESWSMVAGSGNQSFDAAAEEAVAAVAGSSNFDGEFAKRNRKIYVRFKTRP